MKIQRLTEKDQKMFACLDPFQRLVNLKNSEYFAYGVSVIPQDGESQIPTGLLTGMIRNGYLIIDWLYIAKEYRMQGIGNSLLSEVIDLAAQEQIPFVSVYVNTALDNVPEYDGAEGYFREHLFFGNEELPDEWMTILKSRPLPDKAMEGRILTAEVASYHEALMISEDLSCYEFERQLKEMAEQLIKEGEFYL